MNLLLFKGRVYTLYGNGLLTFCRTVTDDQTAEIGQETENDNAKDNDQESRAMVVGEHLKLLGCPADA